MPPAPVPAGTGERPALSYRLPRTVEPVTYRLVITPDFDGSSFSGSVDIDVIVHEPVEEIVLNAAELAITGATVVRASGDALRADVQVDASSERARLKLPVALQAGDATVGITFTGVLYDQLQSFYRSSYADADGTTTSIGTTKMFLANARRSFPCWDEPDRKATFEIALVVDEGLAVVSNAPLAEETRMSDGKRHVRFTPTERMSTYLVAFVVGPLEMTEPLDVRGTPVRVVHVPGKAHLTAFALDAARHALEFLTEYCGTPYPFAKLDLVGIPDFPGGGAENPGCVTFHEAALLVDPLSASREELERVATVVHHEIAHMWFGDLVTMAWWDGSWLNEGFTTFMDLMSVDHYRPTWQRWTTFGVDRDAALAVDGLHSTRPIEYHVETPDDAGGMFSVLTYQKGASVLRMLEQYVGPETFREAIRDYLQEHAYGNTVTADFWRALEDASGEQLEAVGESWVLQGGYPLVHVEGSTIFQEPFAYLPDSPGGSSTIGSSWSVPLLVRRLGDNEGAAPERLVLGPDPVALAPGDEALPLANAGGWGAYRVDYSDDHLRALAGRLPELDPLERFCLFSDMWALVLSGRRDLAALFDLAGQLENEGEPGVYRPVVAALAFCERIATEAVLPAVAAATRALLSQQFETVGWDPEPDEGVRLPSLRALLIETLGTRGKDDRVRGTAARRFEDAATGAPTIDPDLEPAVLAVVADLDRGRDYDTILERYREPTTPQDERRCLIALASFPDVDRCLQTFELALGEARSTDGFLIVRSLLANRVGGPTVWQRVKAEWPRLLDRIPVDNHTAMVSSVPMLCTDDEIAQDVEGFLGAQQFRGGRHVIRQTLERLEVNVRLAHRLRVGDTLEEALARVTSPSR